MILMTTIRIFYFVLQGLCFNEFLICCLVSIAALKNGVPFREPRKRSLCSKLEPVGIPQKQGAQKIHRIGKTMEYTHKMQEKKPNKNTHLISYHLPM